MSHVSIYLTMVKDVATLKEVAKELGYSIRENVTVQLFGSNVVHNATEIHITGWRYPVAITEDGSIKYDFFGSERSAFDHLGKMLQETDRQSISNLCLENDMTMDSTVLDNEDIRIEILLSQYEMI